VHDPLVVAFQIKRPWPDGGYKTATGHRRRHWPAMVTIWHREPGGHDSGTLCKWNGKWRWHVHHYRIQIPPLQHLRRRLLTRCAWCGGRSRKGDPVNYATSWNRHRTRWWQGETGLLHSDCHAVLGASRACLCDTPAVSNGWGKCGTCGKFRAWGAEVTEADRLLAALPTSGRIPLEMRPRLEAIWDERLIARGVDPSTTIKPWGTK
jgi:hypothetical protein